MLIFLQWQSIRISGINHHFHWNRSDVPWNKYSFANKSQFDPLQCLATIFPQQKMVLVFLVTLFVIAPFQGRLDVSSLSVMEGIN